MVAIDRGYIDYWIFFLWTEKKVWFVTHMKDNAAFRVVEKREIPKNRNIIADEVIELTGVKAEEKCPYLLRRVVVWDEENERKIVLLANNLNFGATTADRIVFQSAQTEFEDQNLCRDNCQCLAHTDLDSIDCIAIAQVYAIRIPAQLVDV